MNSSKRQTTRWTKSPKKPGPKKKEKDEHFDESRKKELAASHRSIGRRGVGAAAPPKFRQLRLFGQQGKFGQSQFLISSHECVRVVVVVFCLFSKRDIFCFKLKSAW